MNDTCLKKNTSQLKSFGWESNEQSVLTEHNFFEPDRNDPIPVHKGWGRVRWGRGEQETAAKKGLMK